jgi:PAS domain-containing protein
MIHPEDRDHVEEAISGALAGSGVIRIEFRIKKRDGATVWLASRGHVTFDAKRQPISVAGETILLTDHKSAPPDRASKLAITDFALAVVIDHVPFGVLVVDAGSGSVIVANDKLRKLLGHEGPIDSYRDWVMYHPEGVRYELSEHPVERCLSRGESILEEKAEIELPDGRRERLTISCRPMRRAGDCLTGVFALLMDSKLGDGDPVETCGVHSTP